MDRLKKFDETALIMDAFILGEEFQVHIVCKKEEIDEVKNVFGESHKLKLLYKRKHIKYHYKWDRQFAIKPEDTI